MYQVWGPKLDTPGDLRSPKGVSQVWDEPKGVRPPLGVTSLGPKLVTPGDPRSPKGVSQVWGGTPGSPIPPGVGSNWVRLGPLGALKDTNVADRGTLL